MSIQVKHAQIRAACLCNTHRHGWTGWRTLGFDFLNALALLSTENGVSHTHSTQRDQTRTHLKLLDKLVAIKGGQGVAFLETRLDLDCAGGKIVLRSKIGHFAPGRHKQLCPTAPIQPMRASLCDDSTNEHMRAKVGKKVQWSAYSLDENKKKTELNVVESKINQ